MTDLSKSRKPSARRHVHPDLVVGSRSSTCQRSTHAQDRSCRRLPSQGGYSLPSSTASAIADRSAPDRVTPAAAIAGSRGARHAVHRVRASGRHSRERRAVERIERKPVLKGCERVPGFGRQQPRSLQAAVRRNLGIVKADRDRRHAPICGFSASDAAEFGKRHLRLLEPLFGCELLPR